MKSHKLSLLLCLLPLATMARDLKYANTGETVQSEIEARMMQYADELNELAIVSSTQLTFSEASMLTTDYVHILKDKVTTLDERFNAVNIRWNTFIQAMQTDIANDEDLMNILTNVVQLKQSVADTIAVKKECCNALLDYVYAEQQLAGQDTVYKKLYHQAFELSLVGKLAPQLEKLKVREQTRFAQLQESYRKAQKACEIIPILSKRMSALEETFANIQMVSKKIQETTYKPFIQRIKDYLIGMACVAMLLLFVNMLRTRYKQFKTIRQQAKQYKEMMQKNGADGRYPTI